MEDAEHHETAYVAVGSNVEPESNVPAAVDLLAEHASILAISTFYKTPALRRPGDPPFSNGVIAVTTHLEPLTFRNEVLREIENRLGRVRGADAYAPRTIDLDLILYGDREMRTAALTLPDPDIRARDFVAVPLAEIAPDLRLPDTGERVRDLAVVETAVLNEDQVLTRELQRRILL